MLLSWIKLSAAHNGNNFLLLSIPSMKTVISSIILRFRSDEGQAAHCLSLSPSKGTEPYAKGTWYSAGGFLLLLHLSLLDQIKFQSHVLREPFLDALCQVPGLSFTVTELSPSFHSPNISECVAPPSWSPRETLREKAASWHHSPFHR